MVSRRAFLKLTGAASLAAGCGVDPLVNRDPVPGAPDDEALDDPADADLVDEDEDGVAHADLDPLIEAPESTVESALFPLGVSAGDLDNDRVTLWTRYDGDAPLALVVWRMRSSNAAEYARMHRVVNPVALVNGFAHVDVDGLVAGARYRYAFFELDASAQPGTSARIARSVVGNLRAPFTGAEPLVLGAVSCTNEDEPFTVLARAAERASPSALDAQPIDAFLFLGDTAYCDGAENADEYRAKWQAHLGKPEHIAVRAATSCYATWDDHEVKNDWNPESIDPAHFDAARAALFEHMPVRKLMEDPKRIWRSRKWGTTAEVFVLDSRSERLPSTIFGENEQYLSRPQMDWLKAGLLESDCAFKVIMNSVPITRFPNIWNAWQVDRWDAYDAQRTEILAHIDDNAIPGVLWVSGDFHLAKMGFVSPEGSPGASQVEVLVGPGAQGGNALASTLIDDYFHWKSTENNYTELHLDPATGYARIVYVNAAGEIFAERTYPLG
jgi:alkaline phosphatase D